MGDKVTDRRGGPTELLEFGRLECGHTRQGQVSEPAQPIEQVRDRLDRDQLAIRQMDPLERRLPLD